MTEPRTDVDLVKSHEGLRLQPYVDTRGHRTIGWGRRIPEGWDATGLAEITEPEARRMLAVDMAHAREAVRLWMQGGRDRSGIPPLSDARHGALVDMAFNLGARGLAKFRRMRSALVASNYALAAVEMLDSAWAGQVGARAREDAEIMRTGRWPGEVTR